MSGRGPMTAMLVSFCVLFAGSLSGQSSLAHYDTTKPMTVKGILFGMATLPSPQPVYLLVQVQDVTGKTERWAIEASPMAELRKLGWTSDTLKGGESIGVRAYRAKPGAPLAGTIPNRERALATVFELAKEGRLLRGAELTLADGRKLGM
jgi:hypothetical protein